jgi:serine phosphatase RsbU (regulator of sigma subunit)
LDDSGWEDGQGRWLLPPFDSDGFVWMRTRVTIPLHVSEPLAVRLAIGGTHPGALTVYVNGRAAGTEGGFPPQGAPKYLPATAVFNVPTGAAAPGSTAVVAVRAWYMPRSRPMSRSFHATTGFLENTGSISGTSAELTIDSAATLRAVDRSERLSKLLGSMPDLAVNALLCLAGLALIVFWRWTRRAELAWCSALLISDSVYEYFFMATDRGSLSIHYREWGMLFSLLSIVTMMVAVEFVRVVHGLRGGVWRWGAHGCWIVAMAGQFWGLLAFDASAGLHAALAASVWAVEIFSLIMVCANLWVLLVLRYNRVIAGAMASVSLAAGAAHLGLRQHWMVGTADISLFDVATIVSGFAIAAMLIQRAVQAWSESNRLRAEFEAAREVQQVLVPAEPPAIKGFRIEGVYKPAGQVGGDFYQIVPTPSGGALIVIGDVSGKGMPAAMAVSLLVGTFRTLAHYTQCPSEILSAMNQRMLARSRGGFTTCLVLRADPDGRLRTANAGHIAPYCNGIEVATDSGLPLGISADSKYVECTCRFEPGVQLTLLTDGIVEARSAKGELFGFDRTGAISAHSAEQIARAAQAFGQEDDITVLTLARLPVPDQAALQPQCR